MSGTGHEVRLRRTTVAALLWLSQPLGLALGANLLVNSNNDADDGQCNAAHCSLREALNAANANTGPDTISFELGSSTITLQSPLPSLVDDATTINGAWDVALDGSAITGYASGLAIKSSDNRIQGLTISGFNGSGIHIEPPLHGEASHNLIGTDGDGNDDVFERNTIVGNGGSGIQAALLWLDATVEHNVIAGNYIGLYYNSTQVNPNQGSGILISRGSHNRIGPDWDNVSDELERNVISGNGGYGVYIVHGSSNTITGNFIGVDDSGMLALGNDLDGVGLFFSDSSVVGPRNVIGGNSGNGVGLGNASNNAVVGNWIGTDPTGTAVVGNDFNGIRVFGNSANPANHNQIGFRGNYAIGIVPSGNVIAHSAWNGIYIDSHSEGYEAHYNPILYNSIYDNELLGIDLISSFCPAGACTDGVTPNDAGDTDGGGNHGLNHPTVHAAVSDGNDTWVQASITDGLSNTSFILQFFASAECDPAGSGEGKRLMGQTNVNTDASGNGSTPKILLSNNAAIGHFITATATIHTNFGPIETSEFSPCREVTGSELIVTAEVLQHLHEHLDLLVDQARLGSDQAASLKSILESAIAEERKGNMAGVAKTMQRFIRHVERNGGQADMPQPVRLSLVQRANAIIRQARSNPK